MVPGHSLVRLVHVKYVRDELWHISEILMEVGVDGQVVAFVPGREGMDNHDQENL